MINGDVVKNKGVYKIQECSCVFINPGEGSKKNVHICLLCGKRFSI